MVSHGRLEFPVYTHAVYGGVRWAHVLVVHCVYVDIVFGAVFNNVPGRMLTLEHF